MTKLFTMKRIVILAAVMIIGLILGRLAVRMLINLMVGGSLFGGNFL
ncbi:putative membrane protein [Paenibacillus riograndensis SBR5]|uniref:Putative membrane protein n=1 Tax=Paenibacillus riograndensis SBR5 TaxID=1073571 RepID=A0A0E4CW89_9BACL|nr:putative membrane protein [Paenibacillus riograndensis SBR5]